MNGAKHCTQFKRHIHYKIDNIILHEHMSVYEEKLKYLKNDVCKPYTYSIV